VDTAEDEIAFPDARRLTTSRWNILVPLRIRLRDVAAIKGLVDAIKSPAATIRRFDNLRTAGERGPSAGSRPDNARKSRSDFGMKTVSSPNMCE
jgi:hypothetical protein